MNREQIYRRNQDIKENYKNPNHPTAFAGISAVAKYYDIPQTQAREILQELDGYTLHREYKRTRKFNPYFVYDKRKLVEGDLIDFANDKELVEANDDVKYILVLIDVFTRYAWAYPLKNKSAKAVHTALKQWLDSLQDKPSVLQTDDGAEFRNRLVQQLLRQHQVAWQAVYGFIKAAYAERFNKTLQILLHKYMTHNGIDRFIDKLPNFIDTYNNRGHRGINYMTPANAELAQNIPHIRQLATRKLRRYKKRNPIYKIGDFVRVKIYPRGLDHARRAYAEQFTRNFFKVIRINRKIPIPLYFLEDCVTNQAVEGGFYKEELEGVREVFRVERVLRRDRRNNRMLVKFLGFSNQYNQWLPNNWVQEQQ